jgi:hypothetical protein
MIQGVPLLVALLEMIDEHATVGLTIELDTPCVFICFHEKGSLEGILER